MSYAVIKSSRYGPLENKLTTSLCSSDGVVTMVKRRLQKEAMLALTVKCELSHTGDLITSCILLLQGFDARWKYEAEKILRIRRSEGGLVESWGTEHGSEAAKIAVERACLQNVKLPDGTFFILVLAYSMTKYLYQSWSICLLLLRDNNRGV